MRIITFLFVFLVSTHAFSGEIAGVTFPNTVTVGNRTLILNGMALRSKVFFKVYVAGLYLPDKQSDANAILANDTPRQMVMHWLRSVDQSTICEGWQDGLKANKPDASPTVREQFATLCSWMEDSQEGDQFIYTYSPGKGTTVTINGQTKGILSGKEFADALLSVWIGPHPGPGQTFKTNLLGK